MTYSDGNALRDLIEQIASTRDLIRESGQLITLQRDTLVSDGAGGFKPSVVAAQPVQRLALIRVLEDNDQDVVVQQGQVLVTKFVLIGLPTANIQEGDWFYTGSPTPWIVEGVDPDTSYQIKGFGKVITSG